MPVYFDSVVDVVLFIMAVIYGYDLYRRLFR